MYLHQDFKAPPPIVITKEQSPYVMNDDGTLAIIRKITDRCYIWGYYWDGQFKIMIVIRF
jgi:hypothetical protein